MAKREVKTSEQVKADFVRRGETITGWAKKNGFNPNQVVSVLGGRNKGLYGKAHDIAVRLGIKDGVVHQQNDETRQAA